MLLISKVLPDLGVLKLSSQEDQWSVSTGTRTCPLVSTFTGNLTLVKSATRPLEVAAEVAVGAVVADYKVHKKIIV